IHNDFEILLADSYTAQPPCCRDHIGTITCNRLAKTNSRLFTRRCNTDAEFRLIQCCSACNHSSETIAYDLIARSLVSEQCYDRYGSKFCKWNCDGENPQIAFRACRKSCGFCDFSTINYTIADAEKACNVSQWHLLAYSTSAGFMHEQILLFEEWNLSVR
ncbi:unnamed protein product, partial [Haemonchus placei]|uniref:ShKT domain-containing protein n=1 Tax=Haemonchus placei TaxID=6290 RepID=A0A0N4WDX5_HAEPC